MSRPVQLIDDKWSQMKCLCLSEIFKTFLHPTGVLLICAKCHKKFKLESQTGVVVKDA